MKRLKAAARRFEERSYRLISQPQRIKAMKKKPTIKRRAFVARARS
jgi:hypothetical protein